MFNNEKLVAYGILKHSGAPKGKELSATAILKGIMVGKKISHSVSFKFNPATDGAPVLPTIHHLAAKALLKDWQDENKSKTDIVKLSVESSVISSHTAFIAVDEESSEVVSGAMKTWDIQAQRQQQQQQQQYHAMPMSRCCCCCDAAPMAPRSAGGYRGGGGGGGAPLGMKMKKSASPRSRSHRPMVADLLTGGPPPPPMNAMSTAPPPAPPGAAIDDLLGFDTFNSFSASLAPPPPPAAAPAGSLSQPLGRDTGRRKEMAPKAPATHSAFISIQQAAGSWKFDSTLFQLFGKTQKELEDACPGECQGVVAAVWATVLVLTLLRSRFADEQDEWELVGSKAESWVKKQSLPANLTLDSLYSAAQKVLA